MGQVYIFMLYKKIRSPIRHFLLDVAEGLPSRNTGRPLTQNSCGLDANALTKLEKVDGKIQAVLCEPRLLVSS